MNYISSIEQIWKKIILLYAEHHKINHACSSQSYAYKYKTYSKCFMYFNTVHSCNSPGTLFLSLFLALISEYQFPRGYVICQMSWASKADLCFMFQCGNSGSILCTLLGRVNTVMLLRYKFFTTGKERHKSKLKETYIFKFQLKIFTIWRP